MTTFVLWGFSMYIILTERESRNYKQVVIGTFDSKKEAEKFLVKNGWEKNLPFWTKRRDWVAEIHKLVLPQ